MNRKTVQMLASGLFAAGALAIGGCQTSVPQGLPDDAQIEDTYFYGHWHGDDNRQLDITPASGKSFKLRISDSIGSREYEGHLVRVDDFPFAELNLYTPSSNQEDAKKVPVFLYAAVKIEPTKFTFRPLRTEWMKEAVKQVAGSSYIQTPDRPRTEGGVVVKDVETMKTLLRNALKATDSFEKGEEYRRQK